MALTDKLRAIADAIRAKTGGTDALTLDQMASEIDGLSIGGGDDLFEQRIEGTLTEYSNSNVEKISSYAFYFYKNLTSVSFPSVKSIDNSAFYYCSSMTSAIFPSATTIGSDAFSSCTNLTNVSFPASTFIGGSAFSNCSNMTSIIFPAAATIGGNSFYYCSSMTSAIFPSATTIGNYAFCGCKILTSLVISQPDTVCTLSNKNAFNLTPIASGTGYIYVPDSLVEDYKAATNWSTYADQIRPLSEWEAQNNA